MKFLNFKNNKKTQDSSTSLYRKLPQNRESEVFLNTLMTRRRGLRGTTKVRVTKRKYQGLLPKVIIISLLFMTGYLLYGFIFKSGKFLIQNCDIKNAGEFVNEEDLKNLVLNNSKDKNILFYKEKELESTLIKNFLGAKFISVTKNYPDTLDIYVEERIPRALVYNEDPTNLYLIDEQGYVLGKVENLLDLPVVKYPDEIRVGEFLLSDLVPVTMEILSSATKEDLKISSMSFYPQYTQLYVDDSLVLISNEKDTSHEIKVLSAILKKLRMNGENFKKIDLRYEKVIVL